jgi:hypothetical protein
LPGLKPLLTAHGAKCYWAIPVLKKHFNQFANPDECRTGSDLARTSTSRAARERARSRPSSTLDVTAEIVSQYLVAVGLHPSTTSSPCRFVGNPTKVPRIQNPSSRGGFLLSRESSHQPSEKPKSRWTNHMGSQPKGRRFKSCPPLRRTQVRATPREWPFCRPEKIRRIHGRANHSFSVRVRSGSSGQVSLDTPRSVLTVPSVVSLMALA